ncbi:MAG: CHAT domain-containing protein, partial [Geitlerinemataceae cyanobacterium]
PPNPLSQKGVRGNLNSQNPLLTPLLPAWEKGLGDEGNPLRDCGRDPDRIALEAATEEIRALEAEKQQLRQQLGKLDPVSAGLLQVSAPNLAQLQTLLTQPTTALLSFYTTETATYIFILRQTTSGEVVTHCHTCPKNPEDTLQNWLDENWLRPYVAISTADTEDRTARYFAWANTIPDLLAQLSQRLDFSTLIQQHLQGIVELILVPHLLLHLIPFAALPLSWAIESTTGELPLPEYLGDLFQLRQVPNTQVLGFCHNRKPLEPSHHGTVEDATDDLPCANFEGERVAQLLNIPHQNRLRGSREATVARYRHLIAQTHSLLSSHHAQSRLDSPLESALLLADGSITLGQLLSPAWRLPDLGEVFLSCCETGLGFSTDRIDEPLSLATGFLCAGARNVVSTLWSVDDLATSLFTIRYYHHRQILNRPAALQAAQRDLRILSGKALKRDYYKDLNAMLEDRYDEATARRDLAKTTDPQVYERWATTATKIDKAQSRLKDLCKQDFPFANPVYWSGFVSQGVQ